MKKRTYYSVTEIQKYWRVSQVKAQAIWDARMDDWVGPRK